MRLLNSAADLGEYVVGIRSDESNRAYNDDQNHSQHDRVLRDVLTLLIIPQLLKKFCHGAPLISPKIHVNLGATVPTFTNRSLRENYSRRKSPSQWHVSATRK